MKSGVFDDGQWFPSNEGTPKTALHGLEMIITKHSLQRKCPALVRYADDFVVEHEDREMIEKCQQTSIDWLAKMVLPFTPQRHKLPILFILMKGK
ncbi:MAG: hypothetical protein LVT47_16000 [Cyanobacteria bacterium LVE1205-1]